MRITREYMFIGTSCRYDLNLLNPFLNWRHISLGRILNPSFSSIRNDEHSTLTDRKIKDLTDSLLKHFQRILQTLTQFQLFNLTVRMKEGRTQQCIIPVKYKYSLLPFRLLIWWEPDFMLTQIGKELISNLFRRLCLERIDKVKLKAFTFGMRETSLKSILILLVIYYSLLLLLIRYSSLPVTWNQHTLRHILKTHRSLPCVWHCPIIDNA